MTKRFMVLAGKDSESFKYAVDFETLDEAIAACDSLSGMPFVYIKYDGRFITVLHKEFNPLS